MRIVFLGQTGPYGHVALRQLLRAPAGLFEIALVVEGLRRPPGRSPHREWSAHPGPLPEGEDLTALAIAAGIPVLQTSDVNDGYAIRCIAARAPDWLVCVGYDRLFGRELLSVARCGGINTHPSRLPDLRGPSPLFWAVKHAYRRLAVTLHALDPREDHGPIYAQRDFDVPRRATGDDLFNISGELGGRMLIELLGHAKLGELVGLAQDERRATRAPRPTPDDVQIVPRAWRCEHLVDFACAAPFFRTPFLSLGQDTVFLRRGLDAELGRRLPGDYLLQGELLLVQCQDGVASLEAQI